MLNLDTDMRSDIDLAAERCRWLTRTARRSLSWWRRTGCCWKTMNLRRIHLRILPFYAYDVDLVCPF
jgi:hypothetical protein